MSYPIGLEKRKGILLVLTAGVCWGIHGVFIKFAYRLGASFMEVFLVEGVVASCVFLGLLWKQKSYAIPRAAADWLWLTAAGFASLGVGSFLFLSFSLGPIAIGATLLFLYLPQVYFISILLSSEKPDLLAGVSIFLLLAGAALATGLTSIFSEGSSNGVILSGLAASTCYATIFILTPKLSQSSSATFRSFFLSAFNVVGSLLVLYLLPSTRGTESSNLPALLGLTCVLGIVGQALPVLAMMKGIPLAGSSLSGVLASTELPIAVITSALILGESLTLQRGSGVTLAFLGIILFNLRNTK